MTYDNAHGTGQPQLLFVALHDGRYSLHMDSAISRHLFHTRYLVVIAHSVLFTVVAGESIRLQPKPEMPAISRKHGLYAVDRQFQPYRIKLIEPEG